MVLATHMLALRIAQGLWQWLVLYQGPGWLRLLLALPVGVGVVGLCTFMVLCLLALLLLSLSLAMGGGIMNWWRGHG